MEILRSTNQSADSRHSHPWAELQFRQVHLDGKCQMQPGRENEWVQQTLEISDWAVNGDSLEQNMNRYLGWLLITHK